MKKRNIKYMRQALATAVLVLGSAPVLAAEFTLSVQPFDKAMPDGSLVTMWGYALQNPDGVTFGPPSAPGPVLRVPAGDTSLTLHIVNNLTTTLDAGMTSIVIPGTVTPMTPVMMPPDAQGRTRVRSFTTETAPLLTGDYTWTGLQPGTYLYHSGTHPQVQVQMGLYGALVVDGPLTGSGGAQAYPEASLNGVVTNSSAYSAERILVYSEVDPVQHAAIVAGTYGPGQAITSTLHYLPKYFLVNGEGYVPGVSAPVLTGDAGQNTLLRMLNAGLDTHVPVLQGLDMSIVAEDAKPYPFARTQYAALLPALKTKDAIVTPAHDGLYPLYDRRLFLRNGASSPGGMITVLQTGTGIAPPPAAAAAAANNPPVAVDDSANFSISTDLAVNIAVLANDSDPDNDPLVLSGVGNATGSDFVVTMNADNTVTITPAAGVTLTAGTFGFDYTIQDRPLGDPTALVATGHVTVNVVQ